MVCAENDLKQHDGRAYTGYRRVVGSSNNSDEPLGLMKSREFAYKHLLLQEGFYSTELGIY
jgi:hypothetical protein